MSEYYDDLETRTPQQREAAQFSELREQLLNAQRNAPAYQQSLCGIDADEITDRSALAALPVTRKSELSAAQAAAPPFGGYATVDTGQTARIFGSPGPIFEPETSRKNYWRLARAMFAAGFRRGDLVHNTFSYHFSPAGSIMETGAHALGCAVFAAGVGQTELQVGAISHLKPRCYAGTPSFLKIILDKAQELGTDIATLRVALVGGEALPPSLRDDIASHGIGVLQCYATGDLGLIAYESQAKEGLISDEGIILEIVRPGTGDPVAPGEVGEVVVTTLNPDYPLIRFATGDLSALLDGPSPCGRTNVRIKGWMGRADQTTKVKGMFVHPSQVAAVVARHPEIRKVRLVVSSENNQDSMKFQCEVDAASDDLADAISATIREVCKLRGVVEFVSPRSLPNDGKVIDDIRTYE